MLTGNKGEWSELYAFIYILSNGECIEKGLSNKVVSMTRFECGQEKEYVLENDVIITNGKIIDSNAVRIILPEIFQEIKNGKGSFSCLELEKIMKILDIERIRASSSNKDDFKIKFQNSEKYRGFNVKSKIGSPASIINASKKTNFTYRIFNFENQFHELNQTGPKNIVKTIYESGGYLKFLSCCENYKINLGTAITPFSRLLLEYFKGNGVNISNLVDKIFEEKLKKMRKIKNKNIKVDGLPKNAWFNEISRILVASGEFMIPSKVKISSDCSASGGLVFVEKEGSINCTIYTSKDDARKYLYETSFLDTASTSRHSFGKIYKQPYDEFLAINLNLNIKGGN